jgi:uridine kinase
MISLDSFYKDLTEEQRQNASEYNFDHPNAFDFDALIHTLKQLKRGMSVEIPIYDFKRHGRLKETETKYGADVIIVEGILVLYPKELRDLFDIKLFVEEEPDICLARRLRRDIVERGRSVDSVLKQYEKFVKPAFEDYIAPTKKYADIILPRGQENKVGINLIAEHIKSQLLRRGWRPTIPLKTPPLETLPSTVYIMKSNRQIESIQTIIRDRDTPRDDFVFFADRLSRLVIEEALKLLPSEEVTVETPTGALYRGVKFTANICALPIMRGGDTMVHALCSLLRDPLVGKILIQSDKNKTPSLFFYKIPKNLSSYYVFVLDPLLGSGNTVIMAIRLLLEHHIPQEQIIFVTLIASRTGIINVTSMYPKVRIVTSAVDPSLNQMGYIIPGVGNFGDRYFGTESSPSESSTEETPKW